MEELAHASSLGGGQQAHGAVVVDAGRGLGLKVEARPVVHQRRRVDHHIHARHCALDQRLVLQRSLVRERKRGGDIKMDHEAQSYLKDQHTAVGLLGRKQIGLDQVQDAHAALTAGQQRLHNVAAQQAVAARLGGVREV